MILNEIGKCGESREAFRQSMTLVESLLIHSPNDHDLKYQLAISQSRLAQSRCCVIPVDTENIYRSVASRAAELVADDPANPEYRRFQGDVLGSWGTILSALRRLSEAETILRQAVTIEEGLVRDFPQVPEHQAQLADALEHLGNVLRCVAKFEEAEQIHRRALEILEKLVAEHPTVPDYRSLIGDSLNLTAIVLMDRGNWEEARQLLEQAITHQKAALETNPRQIIYMTIPVRTSD